MKTITFDCQWSTLKTLRQNLLLYTSVLLISVSGCTTTHAEPINDERSSALHQLTEEHALNAKKLIKYGKSYSLGMVIGNDDDLPGVLHHRRFRLMVYPGQGGDKPMGKNRVTFLDDFLMTGLGNATQIDGLGHIGVDFIHNGDTHVDEFFHHTGLKKFGIHTLPPVTTRGVLLDFAAHRKTTKAKPGDAITEKDIRAMMKAQAVDIQPGDVVMFHTGWNGRWYQPEFSNSFIGFPGLGVSGAEYLVKQGVVAVGTDTPGMEVYPAEDPEMANPVHVLLLKEHGIHILENLVTRELAADKAYEFMFVLGTPRIKGAVQGIINPVAIR